MVTSSVDEFADICTSASKKSPQRGLKTIVENYLSDAQRDEPSDGWGLAIPQGLAPSFRRNLATEI
jgi:hypothetical protein